MSDGAPIKSVQRIWIGKRGGIREGIRGWTGTNTRGGTREWRMGGIGTREGQGDGQGQREGQGQGEGDKDKGRNRDRGRDYKAFQSDISTDTHTVEMMCTYIRARMCVCGVCLCIHALSCMRIIASIHV